MRCIETSDLLDPFSLANVLPLSREREKATRSKPAGWWRYICLARRLQTPVRQHAAGRHALTFVVDDESQVPVGAMVD